MAISKAAKTGADLDNETKRILNSWLPIEKQMKYFEDGQRLINMVLEKEILEKKRDNLVKEGRLLDQEHALGEKELELTEIEVEEVKAVVEERKKNGYYKASVESAVATYEQSKSVAEYEKGYFDFINRKVKTRRDVFEKGYLGAENLDDPYQTRYDIEHESGYIKSIIQAIGNYYGNPVNNGNHMRNGGFIRSNGRRYNNRRR